MLPGRWSRHSALADPNFGYVLQTSCHTHHFSLNCDSKLDFALDELSSSHEQNLKTWEGDSTTVLPTLIRLNPFSDATAPEHLWQYGVTVTDYHGMPEQTSCFSSPFPFFLEQDKSKPKKKGQ